MVILERDRDSCRQLGGILLGRFDLLDRRLSEASQRTIVHGREKKATFSSSIAFSQDDFGPETLTTLAGSTSVSSSAFPTSPIW